MGWWFPELTAVFLVASIIVAIIDRIKVDAFMDIFIKGAADLLSVAIIIGVARGVSVIMSDASITDTLLHYCETAVSSMSSGLFAGMNYLIFLVLSFFIFRPVPVLATLSMSIMSPLADFAGVGSRNRYYCLSVCKCDDLSDRTDMRPADGCSGNDKNFFWNMGYASVWKLLVFIAIVTVLVLVLACMFLY